MKYPNFSMSPIVIGFGENNLKKRIISIMNFKKPTALTTALSALLVLGIGSTAAFAVAPKTEDPVTVSDPESVVSTSEPIVTTSEPAVTTSSPAITASEPVSVTDPADKNSETGEPEPVGSADIPDDTRTLPLKWEDGLETPPEGNYIELSSSDEICDKITRYLPISDFDETIIVCESTIKISIHFDGTVLAYEVYDTGNNCNRILHFIPVHELIHIDEFMPAAESTYTHEEILNDGVIRR